LGAAFTLLAFGAEEGDVQTIEKSAKTEGVPLAVVRDTYDGGRQHYESRLILVRPDRHIAWAGDSTPDDAAEVMRQVTGNA